MIDLICHGGLRIAPTKCCPECSREYEELYALATVVHEVAARPTVEPRSGEPYTHEVAELQRLHDSEWRGHNDGIRILGVSGMHDYVEDVRQLVLAWCPDREPRLNLALTKFLLGDYAGATLNAEFALTSVHIAMGKPHLEDN